MNIWKKLKENPLSLNAIATLQLFSGLIGFMDPHLMQWAIISSAVSILLGYGLVARLNTARVASMFLYVISIIVMLIHWAIKFTNPQAVSYSSKESLAVSVVLLVFMVCVFFYLKSGKIKSLFKRNPV